MAKNSTDAAAEANFTLDKSIITRSLLSTPIDSIELTKFNVPALESSEQMQNLLGGTSMIIAMSFLYDGFIDYLLFIVGYENWNITIKDTCKIRKIVNAEKIINYIKLMIFGLGLSFRQPIMIGQRRDYANKNRKL